LKIRILIADDNAVVRTRLRELLGAGADVEVVGEAADGVEAMRLVGTLSPDLVLLDVTMPPDNGIETARRLKEAYPELLVVFLTAHEDEGLLHEALRAGASGYLTKRAELGEILQAIRAASQGDIYVHPAMTPALLYQPITAEPRNHSPVEDLTPREIDVLRLLARGNTNRQVADRLGLSVRTVEHQRARLLGKIGLSSRVELVSYAEEHELI
jgi:DNA-binding NarL/FixJ family response regulator